MLREFIEAVSTVRNGTVLLTPPPEYRALKRSVSSCIMRKSVRPPVNERTVLHAVGLLDVKTFRGRRLEDVLLLLLSWSQGISDVASQLHVCSFDTVVGT